MLNLVNRKSESNIIENKTNNIKKEKNIPIYNHDGNINIIYANVMDATIKKKPLLLGF